AAVRNEFERIAGPVNRVVFSQELAAAELCQQNEQLLREGAERSDQSTVEVLNLAIDHERAEAYRGDQVPAIVAQGSRDRGAPVRVRSAVVRGLGFPGLSRAYQVMGVPKVVMNDRVQFEGAVRARDFLGAVLQAVETS